MAKRNWWQWLLSLFGVTGAAANHLVDRQNGTGLQGTEIGNQINSFINSKTGAHLTGAQQEANAFSARMAEEEFARQEEFYVKYQSPKAMMRQGVNPFGVSGSTGGTSVSGGSPRSVTPSVPQSSNLFDIVQLLFGMQQQKRLNDSQIELNDSAAQRNLSEVNERNINSETLKDMNLATIMEKLSNVELNDSNIKLITSKILNTDADTELKASQLAKVTAEIANIEADTALKRQQINNLIYDIVVERKQIDVFTAQIGLMSSQAAVNREMATKLDVEWRKLLQDYSHDEIMYGFEEVIGRKDANVESGYDPQNYEDKPIMRRIVNVMNFFDKMINISASSRFDN